MDVINEDSIKLSDSDRTLLKISDLTPDVTETQTCNDSSVKSDTDTTHEPVTESGNTPEECSETKTREETGSRVYSVDSGLDLGTGELDTCPGTAEEQQLYVEATESSADVTVSRRKKRQEPVDKPTDYDDEEDRGVYDESFRQSKWIFVKEDDQAEDINSRESSPTETIQEAELGEETADVSVDPDNASPETRDVGEESRQHHMERTDSVSTTQSEVEYREYKRGYRELSIKRIQRKSSLGTYARENTAEISAEKVITLMKYGSDDGLGFHIVGNHPTKVSTVIKGSKADNAGMEIGDVIIAINYDSVLHLNHQKIVDKLREGTGEITIELCKESSFATPEEMNKDGTELYSAYMYKLTNSVLNIWKKRWFVLKSDNCLYYYKNQTEKDILGAIPLSGYMVNKAIDLKRQKDFSLKLVHHTKTYYFAAMKEQELAEWAQLLNEATSHQSTMETWLDVSAHNVGLPALSIRNVDCQGYLYKEGGNYKSWRKRYAVLKDGCLYYYCDLNSRSAQGVAHLHGYTVNDKPYSSKKNAFDLIPPETKMRTFHFHAETEIDKERKRKEYLTMTFLESAVKTDNDFMRAAYLGFSPRQSSNDTKKP